MQSSNGSSQGGGLRGFLAGKKTRHTSTKGLKFHARYLDQNQLRAVEITLETKSARKIVILVPSPDHAIKCVTSMMRI